MVGRSRRETWALEGTVAWGLRMVLVKRIAVGRANSSVCDRNCSMYAAQRKGVTYHLASPFWRLCRRELMLFVGRFEGKFESRV